MIILTGGPGKSYCCNLLKDLERIAFHLQSLDAITIKLNRIIGKMCDYKISPFITLNKKFLLHNISEEEKLLRSIYEKKIGEWEKTILVKLGINQDLDILSEKVRDLLIPDKNNLFELTKILRPYLNIDLRTFIPPYHTEARRLRMEMVFYAYEPEEIDIIKSLSPKTPVVFIDMDPDFKRTTKAREIPEMTLEELKRKSDLIVRNNYEFDRVLKKTLAKIRLLNLSTNQGF